MMPLPPPAIGMYPQPPPGIPQHPRVPSQFHGREGYHGWEGYSVSDNQIVPRHDNNSTTPAQPPYAVPFAHNEGRPLIESGYQNVEGTLGEGTLATVDSPTVQVSDVEPPSPMPIETAIVGAAEQCIAPAVPPVPSVVRGSKPLSKKLTEKQPGGVTTLATGSSETTAVLRHQGGPPEVPTSSTPGAIFSVPPTVVPSSRPSTKKEKNDLGGNLSTPLDPKKSQQQKKPFHPGGSGGGSASFKQLLKDISPTVNEQTRKDATLVFLTTTAQRRWPTCSIAIYGSSANCFGLTGADIDATLFIDVEACSSEVLSDDEDERYSFTPKKTRPNKTYRRSE